MVQCRYDGLRRRAPCVGGSCVSPATVVTDITIAGVISSISSSSTRVKSKEDSKEKKRSSDDGGGEENEVLHDVCG
jgi:hypothetical protein